MPWSKRSTLTRHRSKIPAMKSRWASFQGVLQLVQYSSSRVASRPTAKVRSESATERVGRKFSIDPRRCFEVRALRQHCGDGAPRCLRRNRQQPRKPWPMIVVPTTMISLVTVHGYDRNPRARKSHDSTTLISAVFFSLVYFRQPQCGGARLRIAARKSLLFLFCWRTR